MVTTRLAPPYTNEIINQSDIVSEVSKIVDLGILPVQLSVQARITNSASSVGAFIDGVLATGTVTVTSFGAASGTVVTVDGTALTEGVDWTAETSNDVTADNLQVAINALGNVQAANPAAAIITVKAATVGTAGNALTTVLTSGGGVTVEQATLSGGLANAITAASDNITITAHGYSTAVKITYDVVAGTTVDNLVDATDYWVIKVDDNTIQLATTESNADAGTQIDIAAADDAIGGGSFTITSVALDVDVTVAGSNDNSSFTTVASETHTANGSTLVAIQNITFRYLKVTIEPNDSECDAVVTVHSKF